MFIYNVTISCVSATNVKKIPDENIGDNIYFKKKY